MEGQTEPRKTGLNPFRRSVHSWVSKLERLTSAAPRKLDAALHPMDERIGRTLVRLIRHVGFRTHERQMQFFELAQRHGLHVLENHFYSPVPDTTQLDPTTWRRRADHDGGFDLREDAQLALLEELRTCALELEDVQEEVEDPTQFAWRNPAFWPGDAAAYYCMIRHTGARRVLEVGSGYSTRIAARAALLNGAELTSIEPYPQDFLQMELPGLSRLIKSPVQDVPFEVFEALDEGDILFIDSTHVSKIGSDVNHLFLRVIPRLKPGVVIHVHDIFLPWDVPHGWVVDKKIFWNEQYLLQALLTCNPSFEVLLGNQFMGREHPSAFRAGFPCIPEHYAPGGVSFWFRKLAT